MEIIPGIAGHRLHKIMSLELNNWYVIYDSVCEKKGCVRQTVEMDVHIVFFFFFCLFVCFFQDSCDTSVASLCPNTVMPSHYPSTVEMGESLFV